MGDIGGPGDSVYWTPSRRWGGVPGKGGWEATSGQSKPSLSASGKGKPAAWSFVTQNCLMQSWLDEASESFIVCCNVREPRRPSHTIHAGGRTGETRRRARSLSPRCPGILPGTSGAPPGSRCPPRPGRPWDSLRPHLAVHGVPWNPCSSTSCGRLHGHTPHPET